MLGVDLRVILARAHAEERAAAAVQIVAEILAPAHRVMQERAAAHAHDTAGAERVVFCGGKNVLFFKGKLQMVLVGQLLRAGEHTAAEPREIVVVLAAKRQPQLGRLRRRAEGLFAHLRADNGAERDAAVLLGRGERGQIDQQLSDCGSGGDAGLGIGGVGGLTNKMNSHAAAGAGKGARAGEHRAERKARQVVRAVDLVDLLAVKKLTAQRRARTGLLRALKEQEHAAPDGLPLEHQRDAAQRRGMTVVTAQVRRAALGRCQRVVIRAQRDRGLCALRLTVRGVEAARKLMKLQRGMLAQEGQQGVLCHDLAAGDLRAGVELCAQGDDLIQQDLFHDRSPLLSARRGAWCRARKGGSRRKAVPRWMRAVFYRL